MDQQTFWNRSESRSQIVNIPHDNLALTSQENDNNQQPTTRLSHLFDRENFGILDDFFSWTPHVQDNDSNQQLATRSSHSTGSENYDILGDNFLCFPHIEENNNNQQPTTNDNNKQPATSSSHMIDITFQDFLDYNDLWIPYEEDTQTVLDLMIPEDIGFLNTLRDSQPNVYNMILEEQFELDEQMDYVSTGLSEEKIGKCLTPSVYVPLMTESSEEVDLCCICQVEYGAHEELVKLDCQHAFHTVCIKHWLKTKNLCPLCRKVASSS